MRPHVGNVPRLRLATILVGTGILAYGIQGLLTEKQITQPLYVGEWLVGGVVIHDALIAPVTFALCWLAARHTTPRTRRTLAALLLIVGTATLVAAPILLHGKVAIR